MKHLVLFLAFILGVALAVPAQVSDPPGQELVALAIPSTDGVGVAAPLPLLDIDPVHGGSFGFLPAWTPPASVLRSLGGSAGGLSASLFEPRSTPLRSWLEPRLNPASHLSSSTAASSLSHRRRPQLFTAASHIGPCFGLHRSTRGSA
jgi:hypothetical protein